MWNTPSIEILKDVPRLYETEHINLKDRIIHLHFFIGGCDWFVAEFDFEDILWGYAVLNNDLECAEWGYMSFTELKSIIVNSCIEVDFDLHWKKRSANQIEKICKGMRWNEPQERKELKNATA